MSQHDQRFQFIADRGDARLRLDQAIVRRAGRDLKLSRTLAQQWITSGLVELAGQPARRSSQPVAEGTEVVVTVPDSAVWRAVPEAENLSLAILFEDEHLMAIDKPPGLVVHPTYKHASKTVLNAVLWRLRERPGSRPGVLTRLDKDTSGLVLVALSPTVHATVQADARAGRVRKEYLAVVHGIPNPSPGTLHMPLGRDALDRRRVVVRADGAPSETRYEVVSSGNGLSVVACELVTGRTHQIRVHLSAAGWPIVGDRTYGSPHEAIARQALHAWRVALPHPITRERLRIEAPLPLDFQPLLGAQ